jgi:spore germination cell wall hydrolase CwlJ-like protein
VFRALALATVVATASLIGGCALSPFSLLSPTECMARAMYFESNRSSAEGMLAVGTVVMNRVHDPKFPSSVCGVVGQKNQFAPGVLSKSVKEGKSIALARQVAERVLAGARHAGVRSAKFFHTEGYSFPYTNMHYVLVAGGNAFYEKR